MIHKKCVFCPIAQTFLLLGPLLPAYNFSATMATTYSTYRLRAVASIKFLAIENMPPHFLAHVHYGQMSQWIRIPLGMEVCLGRGDVLDGDPPPPQKGATVNYITSFSDITDDVFVQLALSKTKSFGLRLKS